MGEDFSGLHHAGRSDPEAGGVRYLLWRPSNPPMLVGISEGEEAAPGVCLAGPSVAPRELQDLLSDIRELLFAQTLDPNRELIEELELTLGCCPPRVGALLAAVARLLRAAPLAPADPIRSSSEAYSPSPGRAPSRSDEPCGTAATSPDHETLTQRELDILSNIRHGMTNKSIARSLNISPETVKTHAKNIFAKLGVSTRGEAALKSVALGLVSVTP